MTTKKLLEAWPILTLVFASGTAFAWQEIQRQKLENIVDVVARQAERQIQYGEAIIRLEAARENSEIRDKSTERKLDLLIKMRLEDRRQ